MSLKPLYDFVHFFVGTSDYLYSSARDYEGMKGLVKVDFV